MANLANGTLPGQAGRLVRVRAAERTTNLGGAALRIGQIVLPQPDDGPACGPEGAFDGGITLSVAAEFGEPVCAVAAGLSAVLRATMLETAVNEDSKGLAPKDEIGVAGHVLVPALAG